MPKVDSLGPVPDLELWGGFECSLVRIGHSYRDQIAETGHHGRLSDLDAVAALGIRTLRYPVLWETIAPDCPLASDWSWHDQRLQRLRFLGIEPVVGLIHHGSGPRYTHLLDPEFPEGLARHARNVAERFPWITMFNPVNEPLTTARFSALYGHWYPHARDFKSFVSAFVNQCRAVVLAMRSIRTVTPNARLIQTEDLGKTFATQKLAYQAEHENERRWLTFDLLCGRVDRSHPWYKRFCAAGIPERDLEFFLEVGDQPDLLGINNYLTSERYLDENRNAYPPISWGGNDHENYADVEAVRVDLPPGELGPAARLKEAWERYRLPLALTETHLSCTQDEQIRWLVDAWHAAQSLNQQGVSVRAVTVWSLLGAVDWDTLLTRRRGLCENGAFDARYDPPRPTALANVVASLARTGSYDHPIVHEGWWRRPDRFYRVS